MGIILSAVSAAFVIFTMWVAYKVYANMVNMDAQTKVYKPMTGEERILATLNKSHKRILATR